MRKVKEFIFRDLSSVNENSDLRRVIKTMRLHRISALPVVNALGEYIGCITEQNILNAAVPTYMKSIHNTSFMANLGQVTNHLQSILNEKAVRFVDEKYPWVTPDDSVSYAADLLYRAKGSIVPVLEGKLLVGLLSTIDILYVSIDDH